jgi:hypothetical protein
MPPSMTGRLLDEQVEMLMAGCEFGDPGLAAAMRARLRERLASAAKQNRPVRVYTGYDRLLLIFTSATRSRCVPWGAFSNSVTR